MVPAEARVPAELLVRGVMSATGTRAMQKYLIDKRLVAYAAMFRLGMRPFQRYRMKPDVDIAVFSETFGRAAPDRALYMQSILDGLFKSQRLLWRDPPCF